MRGGYLSSSGGERVGLLLAFLAKQERHGAGSAALGRLQWQPVPVTQAFGLHVGWEVCGVRAGEICLVWMRLGRRVGVRALQVGVMDARWAMCACLDRGRRRDGKRCLTGLWERRAPQLLAVLLSG